MAATRKAWRIGSTVEGARGELVHTIVIDQKAGKIGQNQKWI